MGSVLYFYAYQASSGSTRYALPRLASLIFDPFTDGSSADSLVHVGISGFDILGFDGVHSWSNAMSPLYPTGLDSLTVSVSDSRAGAKEGNWERTWAVDAALRVTSRDSATRCVLVHVPFAVSSSVNSYTRDVITTPAYTCRATLGGSGACYVLSAGRYTWSDRPATIPVSRDMFTPLSSLRSFALPASLWLFVAGSVGGGSHTPVVASGFGTAVAFKGDRLHAIESRADAACGSGRRLFYTVWDAPDMHVVSETQLTCEWRQSLQRAR